jgi:hypothetical protein
MGLLPLLTQGLLSLAHREESGDDVFSSHLQVQGDIKMTNQKTPALLFLFPHVVEQVTQ